MFQRLETRHGWNLVAHAFAYITASRVRPVFIVYLVKNKESRMIRSKCSQTSLRKSMCRKHTIELQTQTYEIMKPFFLFSIDFKMVIILKGFDQIYDFYDCILAWIIRA